MDPLGIKELSEEYYSHLAVLNYGKKTIVLKRKLIGKFINWCAESGIMRINELSREVFERYQKYLYHYRKKDGNPLKFRSQRDLLLNVREMFHYFAKKRYLPYNPAGEIELPMVEKHLPMDILSFNEAERVMNSVDLEGLLGLRDRAVLEMLYSTGMRRSEVSKLKIEDIDMERKVVFIRQTKGKKDRVVPIGERALKWILKYIEESRPALILGKDTTNIFVSRNGKELMPGSLSSLCRTALRKAGIEKRGACHIFRHTVATLMLEGGADIRYVQEMLGHVALTTTQVYTQVSIKKLQEVHGKTHPGNALRMRKEEEEEREIKN